LTNIYRADHTPAIDSKRATVCWGPHWIWRP